MDGRDVNDLKEPSYKLEIVLCNAKKPVILGDLIQIYMSIIGYSRMDKNKPAAARTLACSMQ